MGIPIPVTMTQPGQTGGGLLSSSGPLPGGWERGISFLDANCLEPVLMGECPTGSNLKPTQRPDSALFRPVSAIMAVECTASGHVDLDALAAGELDRVRDFAIARELLTGEISARDANPNAVDQPDGNPSLVGTAVDLGRAFTSVTAMLGCLEASLIEANSGRGGVLLLPVAVATAAFAEGAIWRDGARWRTVAGSAVIVSGGFDGRAPVVDPAPSVPPAVGDPLYAYAVSAVWAGVGERSIISALNRAVNTDQSRAEDIMLAAFSPCAVFAAASTTVTRCYEAPASV